MGLFIKYDRNIDVGSSRVNLHGPLWGPVNECGFFRHANPKSQITSMSRVLSLKHILVVAVC